MEGYLDPAAIQVIQPRAESESIQEEIEIKQESIDEKRIRMAKLILEQAKQQAFKRKEIEPEETDLVECKYLDNNLKKYITKKIKQEELEFVRRF